MTCQIVNDDEDYIKKDNYNDEKIIGNDKVQQ